MMGGWLKQREDTVKLSAAQILRGDMLVVSTKLARVPVLRLPERSG